MRNNTVKISESKSIENFVYSAKIAYYVQRNVHQCWYESLWELSWCAMLQNKVLILGAATPSILPWIRLRLP